jgi:HSP20 family protein
MPREKWGGGNVFTPAVDIKDEENKLVVTTVLPGINKEDIEIDLKEDMLERSAKSGKKKETEDEGYILRKENILTFTELSACLPALKRRVSLQKLKMVS